MIHQASAGQEALLEQRAEEAEGKAERIGDKQAQFDAPCRSAVEVRPIKRALDSNGASGRHALSWRLCPQACLLSKLCRAQCQASNLPAQHYAILRAAIEITLLFQHICRC